MYNKIVLIICKSGYISVLKSYVYKKSIMNLINYKQLQKVDFSMGKLK